MQASAGIVLSSVLLLSGNGVSTLEVRNLAAHTSECHHNHEAALANYKSGKASLFFYHITHHAGTRILDLAKQNNLKEVKDFDASGNSKDFHMWGETTVGRPRQLPKSNLSDILPCNSDHFVSVISMRDPIARIMSGDGCWKTTTTQNTDKCNTDNYGLRWLTGNKHGALTEGDLAFAKERLDMFDVVLVVENITATSQLLCADFGWQKCGINQKQHPVPAEYVPADLLATWTQRNQYEIALYQYAVQKSIAMMSRHANIREQVERHAPATDAAPFDPMQDESHMRWIC